MKTSCLRIRKIRPVFEEVEISGKKAKKFNGKSILTSRDFYKLFRYLSKETREHFISIHLDSKNRLICIDTVAIGSMVCCIVHPREIFKSVLLSSAASIAIVHNHPSGDTEPSQEDILITKKIKEAGTFLGIPLIDHIIIGNGSYLSLFEKNYV